MIKIINLHMRILIKLHKEKLMRHSIQIVI